MSTQLPPSASLRQLKSQAKDLRRAYDRGEPAALERVRQHHPQWAGAPDAHQAEADLGLQDAQLVVAREYGFDSWPRLTAAIEPGTRTSSNMTVISGGSEAARRIREGLERAASADMPVLLVGEKGTGKRLAARALHEASGRHGGPFVQMACDVAADLLGESELVGHEPGAFTGANVTRRGKVEKADGGTLLLDRVDCLSASAQLRLLTVLERGVSQRLGGSEEIAVDARLVATTPRDLRPLVDQGAFREDLYYGLQVLRIDLPPLRSRPEDIPGLARHFAAGIATAAGREAPEITPEALARLTAHPWSGNVRELRHEIGRAHV